MYGYARPGSFLGTRQKPSNRLASSTVACGTTITTAPDQTRVQGPRSSRLQPTALLATCDSPHLSAQAKKPKLSKGNQQIQTEWIVEKYFFIADIDHAAQKTRPVLRQAGLHFKVQSLIALGTTAVLPPASGWSAQHPCSAARSLPIPDLLRKQV